ncbi:MAG: ABC transporter substrate-binding protein [Kutzneria sp.]|nr:ABC transporter substrate-binding protein [Kutzneria sp.]
MRRVSLLAAALATGMAVSSCAAAVPAGIDYKAVYTAPGPDALNGAGEVDITVWHAMTGVNGATLQKLADQFNAQNRGRIKVTLGFKNNYDDTLSAYKNALRGSTLPDIVQVYDIGTQFMIDTRSIVPMQSFVDVDKFDVTDIQPNIAGYYSVGGKLYSMPFNTSMPLLYINRNAFAKAGLDPDKPPTTLDEIMADAEKLTVKDSSGNVVQYGFGASLYGWFLEQWTAVAGQEYCDQGNGRDGHASHADFVTDEHVRLLAWWQRMTERGLALKLDSDTKNGDTAFESGKVAITLESTGSLGDFTKAAFEAGAGYFPKIDATDSGGPIIGGASLWIVGRGKDDAHKRAAWEFTKFLESKDSQATWHTSTGYFPISRAALDTETDRQWVAKKPQFQVAINQLQGTKLTKATQGCLFGVMPQVRKAAENAMQAAVLQGKDARQALQDAQDSLNRPIGDYNDAVGG